MSEYWCYSSGYLYRHAYLPSDRTSLFRCILSNCLFPKWHFTKYLCLKSFALYISSVVNNVNCSRRKTDVLKWESNTKFCCHTRVRSLTNHYAFCLSRFVPSAVFLISAFAYSCSLCSSSSSSVIMGEGRASLPTSQLYTWIVRWKVIT